MKTWIQAARIPSQFYILIPLMFGWALADEAVSYGPLVLLFLLGLSIQLAIVFFNDWADYPADILNPSPTFLSGGSRVLVENKLTPRQLLYAACWFMLGSMIWAWFLNSNVLMLTFLAFVILALYCFPPFQLSYRGLGEILQTLGMGCVLPMMGWASIHSMSDFPFQWLLILFPMHFALACLTTIPDYEGDLLAQKQTLIVRLGHDFVARMIIGALLFAFVLAYALDRISLSSALLLSVCCGLLGSGLKASVSSKTQMFSITMTIAVVLLFHVYCLWTML